MVSQGHVQPSSTEDESYSSTKYTSAPASSSPTAAINPFRSTGDCQKSSWFKTKKEQWRGVIDQQIWTLWQDENYLHCNVIENKEPNLENGNTQIPEIEKIKNYFRLDHCLYELYKTWSLKDPNFASISKDFTGIRILNQNPTENVFSFICSSNNNIERITNLVDTLCQEFGSPIKTVEGRKLFSFPTLASLGVPGTEIKLRKLGFGYRAKYIETTAKMIMEKGGERWLEELKDLSYVECHNEIAKLSGVGPKVSDCICLMSMNHLSAIPVDTHVFQIAARDYLPHLKLKKSLTPKMYQEIGDHFRNLFGSSAGWAHSVLFIADLRKFKISEKPTERQTKRRKRSDRKSLPIC